MDSCVVLGELLRRFGPFVQSSREIVWIQSTNRHGLADEMGERSGYVQGNQNAEKEPIREELGIRRPAWVGWSESIAFTNVVLQIHKCPENQRFGIQRDAYCMMDGILYFILFDDKVYFCVWPCNGSSSQRPTRMSIKQEARPECPNLQRQARQA
jgi:hypothetical protein